MKMKNVSFLERHVEKAVLALGVVFLLAVVWFYAIFPKRVEVKVGNQSIMAGPGQIEKLVQHEADDLERRLKNATPPDELVKLQVPPYAQELEKKVTAPVSSVSRLATPLGQNGLDRTILGVGGQGIAATVKYQIPKPATPDRPVARADFAVLAEIDQPRLRGAWLRILNLDTPGDFRYVSVSSAFDMGEWQKALRQGGQPRIPEEWWRGQLLVTEVILERQTLDPVTGQWGNLQTIPRIPTQSGFSAIQSTLAPENVNPLLTRMRARQPMVLRPRLEPITPDRPWFPPTIDPDALTPRQREQARELLRIMRGVEEQIERQVIGGADPVDGGEDEVFIAPGESAASGMSSMGFDFEAGGIGASSDFNVSLNPGDSLETQLDELQKRLRLVLEGKDLAALDATAATSAPAATTPTGPRPRDIRQIAGARPPASAPGTPAAPTTAMRELGKLQITVHDVTVQPGQTYRYRLRVGVYNPLFRKTGVVAEQRAEYFDRLALITDPTPWTEPVSVDPDRHYFIVSASPEQRSSRWEVWRIHRGRWVFQDFVVRPGDPIGAVVDMPIEGEIAPVALDMSVPAALVDVQTHDYTLGATQRALVLDTVTGSLFERIVSRDRDDKNRDRLRRTLPRPEVNPAPQPGASGTDTPVRGLGRRGLGMGEDESMGLSPEPDSGRAPRPIRGR